MDQTDWNSFDLKLEQSTVPGSMSVNGPGGWNHNIIENAYQSQFVNTVPPQPDAIGNRLSGIGASTGGTRPNPAYEPVSPDRMGIPSGPGGVTPRYINEATTYAPKGAESVASRISDIPQQSQRGISGLPTTGDAEPRRDFREQEVAQREHTRQQLAEQYYNAGNQYQPPPQPQWVQPLQHMSPLDRQFQSQMPVAQPSQQLGQQYQQQQPPQQWGQPPPQQYQQQSTQQWGDQPSSTQYIQQNQPPVQGIQTTRTLGNHDGRMEQNAAIAANRFAQDTMIQRGGPADCHNPVNMEHVYQRSLFLDGAPVPQDLRQQVSHQQWEQHQAMMNQHQTKNSYRDQANNRLNNLTPISRSLAPPVAMPSATAMPGMGAVPSASAHGAAPQASQPLMPGGGLSGGYRSFHKSMRRDDMNSRIANLGYNPGQMPEPRQDANGPQTVDRIMPEVTNF